jgi:hypothetical protein
LPAQLSNEVGRIVGSFARQLDRRFGVREWLRGEPRPPRGGFDLDGEKIIDWGWICVHLPAGPKRALEIGCGESPIIPAMLARRYEVVGVDLDARITMAVNGYKFVRGDFSSIELVPGFDLVIACSAVEHFGLAGRYGSTQDVNADIKAMHKIHSLLSPSGQVLLTIPIGIDAVHAPWHRVYGAQRLPFLIDGFIVAEACFWAKAPWQPWYETTMQHALNQPVTLQRYALGQFILTKVDSTQRLTSAFVPDVAIVTSTKPS